MHVYSPVLVLAALAANILAQTNVTGPFALSITGEFDESIKGYASACHIAAATEGLCYTASDNPVNGSDYEFYYNYSKSEDSVFYAGFLTYILHYTDGQGGEGIPMVSGMTILSNLASNVFLSFFSVGNVESSTYVSADDKGYFYVTGWDDTKANSTQPDSEINDVDLYNWHLCWQWAGGYWLRSIAWVTTLPPHNPSCEPVNLGMADLAS